MTFQNTGVVRDFEKACLCDIFKEKWSEGELKNWENSKKKFRWPISDRKIMVAALQKYFTVERKQHKKIAFRRQKKKKNCNYNSETYFGILFRVMGHLDYKKISFVIMILKKSFEINIPLACQSRI